MAETPFLGAIFMFAGNFAPRGYALCDGQLLPISQNTALFSILGTTYGGNGTQTFALPDLRGRAPVGTGAGPGLSNITLGESSGVENVTIRTTNLPPHTHALSASSNAGTSQSPFGNVLASISEKGYAAVPNTVMGPSAIGLTGGDVPISVRNPFLGINFIIALQGIFPSRN